MSQTLHTKQFGDLKVVMSFHEPPYHVALCENGAYVDINGLPIKDKTVLRKAIPVEFLPDALDWFDHRHEREGTPVKKIRIEPDGSCIFEDGSPVTSSSQLVQAIKPGPMLDAALLWFTKQQIAQEEAKTQGEGQFKSPGKKMKKKVPGKPAPPLPPAQESAPAME